MLKAKLLFKNLLLCSEHVILFSIFLLSKKFYSIIEYAFLYIWYILLGMNIFILMDIILTGLGLVNIEKKTNYFNNLKDYFLNLYWFFVNFTSCNPTPFISMSSHICLFTALRYAHQ